jgi:hypothetical protein
VKLHCPNCGTDFELTAETVGAAIAAAEQHQGDHHIEHCPQCQWDVRVPLAELRAAESIAEKPAAKPKRTVRGKAELVVEITVAPKARGTAKPKKLKAKVSARKPAKPKGKAAPKQAAKPKKARATK